MGRREDLAPGTGPLLMLAGLGDATEVAVAGPAVNFVFAFNLVPLALTVLFMIMLIRMGTRGH